MIKDERGVALLMVTIVSVLLLLIGLSLTFTSLTDFSMSTELVNKKKAFMTANAGFNVTKNFLLGTTSGTLSAELSAVTNVLQYINYPVPTAATVAETYFNRNPISPLGAMNVDFDNPPTPIGSRTVTGLLTPATGTTLATGGRYWAKLTDNDDGDNDLTVDMDGDVFLRVLAIHRNSPDQVSTYGGKVQNSVSIIEATLREDNSLSIGALTMMGPGVDFELDMFVSPDFTVDGYNHPTMTLADMVAGVDIHTTTGTQAGLNLLYDNPPSDAQFAAVDAFTELDVTQRPRLTGPDTDFATSLTSIKDRTQELRNDPDPNAANILDATWLKNYVDSIYPIADIVNSTGSLYQADFGTVANPKITWCAGVPSPDGWGKRCNIEENITGAGLLIVDDELRIVDFALDFYGLILVIGESAEVELRHNTGTKTNILGGIIVAEIDPDGMGGYVYNAPELEIEGAHKIMYSSTAIESALAPLRKRTIIAWREITREIEPSY